MTEAAAARADLIVGRVVAGGARVVASLPDSWLSVLIDRVADDPQLTHVRVSREDDAVAVAAGAALVGVRAAVLCQNAGVLLATNALAAFALHHQLPLLVVAAHRGGPDDGFYYQMYKGQVCADVARAAGLTVHHVRDASDDDLFERAQEQAWLQRRPVVLLCSRSALLGATS